MQEARVKDGHFEYPSHPLAVDRIDEDGARAHARYSEEVLKNPLAVNSWALTLFVDIFNIHAHYHLVLIDTAKQVREIYIPYLNSLRSNVEKHAEWMTDKNRDFDRTKLLKDVSLHMIQRVSHWTTEGFEKARNAKIASYEATEAYPAGSTAISPVAVNSNSPLCQHD